MNHQNFLCAKEAGAILGVSERTAAKLMRAGAIVAFKLSGRVWRTTRADIDAYAAAQMNLSFLKIPAGINRIHENLAA